MRAGVSRDGDFCAGGFAGEVAGIYGDELGVVREKVSEEIEDQDIKNGAPRRAVFV